VAGVAVVVASVRRASAHSSSMFGFPSCIIAVSVRRSGLLKATPLNTGDGKSPKLAIGAEKGGTESNPGKVECVSNEMVGIIFIP
jgi:hypothetical protein